MFGMLIAFCAVAAVPKDFVKEKKEIKTEQVVSVVITNVQNDVWNYDVSPGNYSWHVVINDESISTNEDGETIKHDTFLRKMRQEKGIEYHKKIHAPPSKR